jgi:hypothetical protein
MTASQVFLELTNGALVRPATVRRCVVSKSSTRRKEKEDLGERQVFVEIAVWHCTSSGVSLPRADMRDGGLRAAISFSPRCYLSSISRRRVKSDAAYWVNT